MNFNLHIYSQGLATAASVCLGYLMSLFQFNIQGVPGGMCQTSGECSLC
jgi:hypothetical protein